METFRGLCSKWSVVDELAGPHDGCLVLVGLAISPEVLSNKRGWKRGGALNSKLSFVQEIWTNHLWTNKSTVHF